MLTPKVDSVRKAATILGNSAVAAFCATALVVVGMWLCRPQLGENGDTMVACVAALGGMISMALVVMAMMMNERAAEAEVLDRIAGSGKRELETAVRN